MDNQTPEQPKNFRWVVPALVSIAGLMVAITLITRSNFLEGFLKLIGAGASTIEATVTFEYDPTNAPDVASFDLFLGDATTERLNVMASIGPLAFTDPDGKLTMPINIPLVPGEHYTWVMSPSNTDKQYQMSFTASDQTSYQFALADFGWGVASDSVSTLPSGEISNPADINRDGAVDALDYSAFLEFYAIGGATLNPELVPWYRGPSQ